MTKKECKHEWIGETWKPETQSCKHCKKSWYDVFPTIKIKIHHDHYWGVDYLCELAKKIVICRTCGELKEKY